MIAVLIILAVFSVPLTAIVSSTWLKARRLEADGGGAKLRAELEGMRQQTRELKARVEVLETIATGGEPGSALPERAQHRALPERSDASLEELRELELAARR